MFISIFFLLSFREWSQKALEEEQKKKEDEKRKKEEEKLKKKQQQQLLQQQLLQQNGNKNTENITGAQDGSAINLDPPAGGGKVLNLKKNFASLDCGAKVISANPESQGAGNIISPAR